ncbi:branched-chain alpha-keto acid dehydrogenase E1-alpha subunit [Mycena latifolia]|nr:branched-chain alpha-keto acid dehydrogenase E1-alpha subunit [Mycena latifolia]
MLRPLAAAVPARARAIHLGHLPNSNSPIVPTLSFFNSVTPPGEKIPTFRVLDGLGKPVEGAEMPDIDEPFARKLYEHMQLLPSLDTVLYNVQRQGKISFHMTSHGEEATIIGCAAALEPDDDGNRRAYRAHRSRRAGQYREMGVLLWRGFGVDSVMAQCFGNHEDTSGKGRQMPVHFGSPAHHFHTISSPLATQIPQAAGVGYALRRARPRSIAACFFGEGAASEGDFHAGLLLASTLPAPTLFLARNNGFAISTPSTEQFFGDGIAARGPAYGIDTVRVDGNDVLAVLAAVRAARARTQAQGRAVLVEAMSYRVGHHSTSDDSFAYRQRAEVEDRKRVDNPLARFRLFLEAQGWWSADDEAALKARLSTQVMKAFRRAEAAPRCDLGELFTDVYGGEEPWNITEQRRELTGLLKKYGNTWEPWRTELARFKDKGQGLTGTDA